MLSSWASDSSPFGDEMGRQDRPRRGAPVVDGAHGRRLHEGRGVALGAVDDHHRGRPGVVRPVVVDDGGVAGAPAGVGERLGVAPARGLCGFVLWRGLPGPGAAARCGDGAPLRGGGRVAERLAERQGVERCREKLFRGRGGLRDGDGPPGLLAGLLEDGQAGLERGSAAAVQPPRDWAGEEHVRRGLAARERVPPAAGGGVAVGRRDRDQSSAGAKRPVGGRHVAQVGAARELRGAGRPGERRVHDDDARPKVRQQVGDVLGVVAAHRRRRGTPGAGGPPACS